MSEQNRDLAELVEAWRAGYEATDAEGLKSLWDRNYATLTYMATERDRAMTTWDEISAYYDAFAGFEIKEWRVWDLITDVVTDTVAFAFAHSDGRFTVPARPELGENYWRGRVSFHLLRRDDTWRIIHYEDSMEMGWMVPLVCQWQAPKRTAVASAVRAGDTDGALALLADLATPPAVKDLHAIATRPAHEQA